MPKGVLVTDSYQAEATQKHLASGGKVLLFPKLDKLPHSVEGEFQCDFWSPMFIEAAKKQGGKVPPGTLGILCDPSSSGAIEFSYGVSQQLAVVATGEERPADHVR